MRKFYSFFAALLISIGGFAQLPSLPLDFESATLNYTFTDFDGGASTKIANPQVSGINTSASVCRMVKSSGQVWGGSWIGLAAPIDFSVNKIFKVKVYSPRVGAKLLLKVENQTNPSINYEKEVACTVANAWEDLTFDYSTISTSNQYQKLVFIFDNGTMGDGSANFTFLYDDIRLTTGGGGGGLTQMNLPVTFDDATVNYGLVGFGGAEQSTIVTDPTLATNKVARVIKTNTAELWAGTTVTALSGTTQTGFSGNIPFAAGNTRMNVRVWSPHANIPVRLKVEDKNDPAKSCETEATVTVASGWQTLEFNFANQAAGTAALNFTFSYNKVSIFFNFGTTGAIAGERTYYFDDVKFGAASGGGGGLTQMNLPVTFDDATVNYGLVGFGGAEQSTIVTDPTLATNKVARVIKTNTAELWAGTTVTALSGTTQTGFSGNIPFAAGNTRMNVRVWSPHAGIPVRLKVEDKNDPAKSCETEATVTVASGWQTLEFNFANQAAGTAALNFTFSYNKVSIFFNFGTTGAVAGERTYYFDDVKFGAVSGGGGGLTQMDLPVTFDDATVNYGLVGFGGAEQSTIVTDPTLATNKVARVIKTNTAELWAGTTVTALSGTTQTGFSGNIPFAAGNTRMNVRVWSPHAGIPVRLKVEDKNDPAKSCETEATVTVASGWQTLEFNFANQAAGTAALNFTFNYNKVSIFFNFGTTGAIAGERTYYFDDVKFGAVSGGGGGLTQMNLPVTFDDATVNYGLVGFGGAEQSTIVTDPTLATNKVARVIKTNTAELWAGTTVTALSGTTQTGFSGNIPFAAGNTRMNVRVWSPHAGIPVRLKVEDKNDPAKSCETEATVTVANGWQTLEFNFANQAAGTAALNFTFNYNKVSIFFNFGTTGAVAGERTYYFDDVKFGAVSGGGGGLTQMDLPVTFDDATVNYGLVGFGGAEQSTIVTDPTLATNKVARVIKTNTAELWAGTTVTALNGVIQTSFANNIPFAAGNTRMNVRVWSPHAGIPVRLKVEDKNDPAKSCETEATVTVASGWQTLEFNFANQAAGTAALNFTFNYNKVSIFFNFGTTGAVAGERTYYFDDVKFGAVGGGGGLTQMNLPVTFDDATVNYGLVGFGGAEQSTIVTDPTLATNKVARVIKTNTAELWAGTTVTALSGTTQTGFSGNIPFAAGNTRMNVRVWSPHAGIPVRLKVEDKNDPSKSCETEATVTVASGWQTLEFNFANQAAGTAALNFTFNYNKVSIFFNFGTTGAIAGERTYYFDDVKFGAASGGGGGLTQMNLPVTFDDATVNYGLVGFGGAEQSTIVTDPTLASNKVAKVIKTNTAELWAGTTLTALNGVIQTSFANNIPFSAGNTRMNVRVWSPHAGIQVRLKVEDKTDPTKSCETEATVTVANGWQTLEFNFANQAAGTAALNLGYNFNKVSIFFNFGVTGAVAGERTYYFDDVQFGPATITIAQMNLPVTFDANNVNYGLVGFGGAEQSTVVTDPTLATNKVARVIKTAAAELWAGTTVTALNGVIQTGFANNIPFSACNTKMTVRVWSPHANIPVRLKVEDKNDPTKSCETEATVTVASGWQTLEFNFANQAAGTAALNLSFNYNKASIFFNFGTTGAVAGERTYYFDDMQMGSSNAPAAPTVTSPVTYCPNATATALTATALAGNSLKWYTVATGGTALAAAPIPPTSVAGSTVYYVSQATASGCEGARAAITVVVNPAPAAPATAPVSYCQNATAVALTATALAGNTLRWYTVATGGTGSATAPIPATGTAGTVTYYVSQTSAQGCEGARAALIVTINPAPAAPAVVTPVAYCQNAVSTIVSATAATGNSLNWYNVATGGSAMAIPPTPVTTVAGNQLFYVSQTNNNGCESQRASIAVNINALPAVPVISAAPYTRLFPGLTTTVSTSTAAATYAWFRNGVAISGQTGNSVKVDVNSLGNYSVMITNANGCSRTSSLLAIADSTMGKLFAYPNPAASNFQVRYHGTVSNLQPRILKMHDSKGAEVFSSRQVIFDAYTPITVNVAGLSNGTYSIYLVDNSGKQLASGQVVVAK